MGERYVELPGQEPKPQNSRETIKVPGGDTWEIVLPEAAKHGPFAGFGTQVLLNGQRLTSIRNVEISIGVSDVATIELEIVPANLIISYAPAPDKQE